MFLNTYIEKEILSDSSKLKPKQVSKQEKKIPHLKKKKKKTEEIAAVH